MGPDHGIFPHRQARNIENMKIWVDGLLSDEFEQGRGQLCYVSTGFKNSPENPGPKKFCCLGVISELARRHGVDVAMSQRVKPGEISYQYDGQTDFMPHSVQEWLGVSNENPLVEVRLSDGTKAMRTLSSLNDGEAPDCDDLDSGHCRCLLRYHFHQIAMALIRTYDLPGYDHLLEEADAQTTT